MSGLQYYKSLISDDEVINALIKESKVRSGEIEKVRVRPNINFFQRTVSNLVSSNKRITTQQGNQKQINSLRNRIRKPIGRRKLPHELIKEILSERIKFVKPSKKYELSNKVNSNDQPSPERHDTCIKRNTHSKTNSPIIISDDSSDDSVVFNMSTSNSYCFEESTNSRHKVNKTKSFKKKKKSSRE